MDRQDLGSQLWVQKLRVQDSVFEYGGLKQRKITASELLFHIVLPLPLGNNFLSLSATIFQLKFTLSKLVKIEIMSRLHNRLPFVRKLNLYFQVLFLPM